MTGVFLGLGCGFAEFLLLRILTRGIARQSFPVWVIPCKMGVLALFFVPCALWRTNQLAAAGIACASALIVASVIQFVIDTHTNKNGRTEDNSV